MSFKERLIIGLVIATICIIRFSRGLDNWPRLPVMLGLFLTFFVYFVVASALSDWVFKKFNIKKTRGNGKMVGWIIFLIFLPLLYPLIASVLGLGK